jgi:hypothetical protein
VRVKARIGSQDVWQTREVNSQSGGCNSAQSPLNAHFGLGDALIADSLVVRWPSGIVQVLADVAADQFLVVAEPQTGAEERPDAGQRRATTCKSPARGLKAGVVAFDVMGRKVAVLGSGVYFVRGPEARAGKIVVQR